MKCLSCDDILTDSEARKTTPSGYYVDLCEGCYSHIKDDVESITVAEKEKDSGDIH